MLNKDLENQIKRSNTNCLRILLDVKIDKVPNDTANPNGPRVENSTPWSHSEAGTRRTIEFALYEPEHGKRKQVHPKIDIRNIPAALNTRALQPAIKEDRKSYPEKILLKKNYSFL